MSDDHLSKSVSVSAKLTETGITAAAESRAISAFDRLLGNIFELANAPLENIAGRSRARGAADIALIKRAGELRLDRLHEDPATAAIVFDQHLEKIGRRHANKSAVVAAAIEDLRRQPPPEDETDRGGTTLEPAFLDRLERFAEDASTEQLRERWGRVLASEIRKPGTFSSKVMRVVDELDPKTAAVFEQACKARLANILAIQLLPELTFAHRQRLLSAGLLFDPGLGHITNSTSQKDDEGVELHFFQFGDIGFSVPAGTSLERKIAETKDPIIQGDAGPALPVYILTEAGLAIASILDDVQEAALERVCDAVAQFIAPGKVEQYRRDGKKYEVVRIWQEEAPSPESATGDL